MLLVYFHYVPSSCGHRKYNLQPLVAGALGRHTAVPGTAASHTSVVSEPSRMFFGLVLPILLLPLTRPGLVRGQSSPQDAFMIQYFERRLTQLEVRCARDLSVFPSIPVKASWRECPIRKVIQTVTANSFLEWQMPPSFSAASICLHFSHSYHLFYVF